MAIPTPFDVGDINCYLIKCDPPLLIDPGPMTDAAHAALCDGLGKQGYSIGDIGHIFVTHGHLDHAGMVGRLLEESGAEAFAHPHAAEQWRDYERNMARTEKYYAEALGMFGVPADIVEDFTNMRKGFVDFGGPARIQHAVEDGAYAGPLRAVHAPGHSRSCTLFVDETQGTMFTGDHLFRNIRPNPLLRPPDPGETRPRPLIQLRNSLRRTRDIDASVCYPGHAKPFDDLPRVIDRLLKRQERAAERIFTLLGNEQKTPYQMVRRLFPRLKIQALHMGVSAVVGHLDVLEEQGRVQSEFNEEGVCHYRQCNGG